LPTGLLHDAVEPGTLSRRSLAVSLTRACPRSWCSPRPKDRVLRRAQGCPLRAGEGRRSTLPA